MTKKPVGWPGEPERHSEAAKKGKWPSIGEVAKRTRRSQLIERLRMAQAERDVHAAREREMRNKLEVLEGEGRDVEDARADFIDEIMESSEAVNKLAREIRVLRSAVSILSR